MAATGRVAESGRLADAFEKVEATNGGLAATGRLATTTGGVATTTGGLATPTGRVAASRKVAQTTGTVTANGRW